MCRGFKSLLRYHRIPHSSHTLREGLRAERVVVSSRNFDLDTALATGVTGGSNQIDQVVHGLGGPDAASPHALSEYRLEICDRSRSA